MEQQDFLSTGDGPRRLTRDDIRRVVSPLGSPSLTLSVRGDHDLNPGLGPPARLRDAAVLVPIVDRSDGLTVMFTRRTAHLAAHAGQISFPGGGVEPDDPDDEATALRETEEEIGLPGDRIDVVGRLDTYVTRTGFRITPVVGIVRPPFILKPDPYEVDEVFEVPLGFILDPRNRQRHSRDYQGVKRYYYAFPYPERYIWGATAGMLVNLCDAIARRC